MGMFDYLQWKDELPLKFKGKEINQPIFKDGEEHLFQTKDLDSRMDLFIVENGKLSYERVEREWVDSPDDGFLGGYFQEISKEIVPYYITATVDFYHYIYDYDENNDAMIEFQVIFINGKVDKVELTKLELYPNDLRKKQKEEMKQRLLKEKQLQESKYYFLISFWRSIRKYLARRVRYVGDKISKFGGLMVIFSYRIY